MTVRLQCFGGPMDGSGVDRDLVSSGSLVMGVRRYGYRACDETLWAWGWARHADDCELVVEYVLSCDERGEYLEFGGYHNLLSAH